MVAFKQKNTGEHHLALIKGSWSLEESIPVRVHSSCMTGDIFGSCRCDCGPQLHKAMEIVNGLGKGLILYMNQEGRGSLAISPDSSRISTKTPEGLSPANLAKSMEASV